MNLVLGDVYLNPSFGDCWTVGLNNSLIRINTGETIYLEDSFISHFKHIGHIEGVQNLDTSFHVDLNHCPLCGSHQVSCVLDFTVMKWKVGCKTSECPCCVEHMIGTYKSREDAVRNWNKKSD